MDRKNDIYISYIIPCFNIQDYLPKCLNCLSSQQISDECKVEFVLVNDGSTDNTLSLLREFEKKETRAVVIDQQNKGVSAARNTGLKVAKGKYVFFLDSDDWLTENATQILYDLSKENAPDIIVTNAYIVTESTNQIKEWNVCKGLAPNTYSMESFLDKLVSLPISFKTYQREMLLSNNVFYDEDLKVGEVYTFFVNALRYSRSVTFSDSRVMFYLKRGGSVMREFSPERDRLIIKMMHRLDEYARGFTFNIKEKKSYHMGLFTIVNVFSVNKYLDQKNKRKDVLSFLKSVVNDRVYKQTLKYFISEEHMWTGRFIEAAILYCFPIRIALMLLKLKSRLVK